MSAFLNRFWHTAAREHKCSTTISGGWFYSALKEFLKEQVEKLYSQGTRSSCKTRGYFKTFMEKWNWNVSLFWCTTSWNPRIQSVFKKLMENVYCRKSMHGFQSVVHQNKLNFQLHFSTNISKDPHIREKNVYHRKRGYSNSSVRVCVWTWEREMYVTTFKSFLPPFDSIWEIKLCVITHASSLSHELLNMHLFFFITSNASDGNYLANKDRSSYYKDQPLKEEKIAFYPL